MAHGHILSLATDDVVFSTERDSRSVLCCWELFVQKFCCVKHPSVINWNVKIVKVAFVIFHEIVYEFDDLFSVPSGDHQCDEDAIRWQC